MEVRRFVLRGRVQGVGFRWQARERALALELVGWVRNHLDGHVELVAGGQHDALETLAAWLDSDDSPGDVSQIENRKAKPSELASEGGSAGAFEIRPTAGV